MFFFHLKHIISLISFYLMYSILIYVYKWLCYQETHTIWETPFGLHLDKTQCYRVRVNFETEDYNTHSTRFST